jgi:hypothetical protein
MKLEITGCGCYFIEGNVDDPHMGLHTQLVKTMQLGFLLPLYVNGIQVNAGHSMKIFQSQKTKSMQAIQSNL